MTILLCPDLALNDNTNHLIVNSQFKHPLGAFTDFMQLLILRRLQSSVLFYRVSHFVNFYVRLDACYSTRYIRVAATQRLARIALYRTIFSPTKIIK